MSIMKRMGLIFRTKANKALDRAEDPRETLDYSYQRQLELLQKVRRGVADVATSRKRSGLQQQVDSLQQQHAQLQGEEEKLTLASQRLQAKVEAFRTQKESMKATYTAAEAQTKIGEAFSGISEEMGDVGYAMQRAQDKTAQMQARAGAIDELLASGALEDVSSPGGQDDISRELDAMSSTSDVELELAQMKQQVGGTEKPKEIDPSDPASAAESKQRQEGEQA
jgi:phage shock protein A